MERENEIWKPIEGYSNYEVSNMGRVKSLNYRGHGVEQILKPNELWDGYLQVSLSYPGGRKMFLVHRLVADAFIPNPDHKPCVNHRNELKSDNRAENLEWTTYQENNIYGTRLSRAKSKLTNKPKSPTHRRNISRSRVGLHWFNDGQVAVMRRTCPDGFRPGKL